MRKFASFLTPFLFAASCVSNAFAEDVAIVGGTVHTMDGGNIIENGVVIISGDTIEAVGGAETEVPEGYRVIDATGKWVTPGMVNAYTQIGTDEVSLETATVNHTIEETFYNAGFELEDGINPDSPQIEINRIEGLTRAVVVPGTQLFQSKNPNKSIFAGQAAVIHLGDGYDLVFKSQAAVVAYLGSAGAATVGASRGALMAYLKGALAEAPTGRRSRSSDGKGKFLKSAADKDAMARVVSGETPLYVFEQNAAFILQLLELKETYENLKLVIMGADEAWMVADEIAAADVPLVIAPTNNLPGNFESLGATLYNAARLEQAGVLFAITTGGFSLAHNARLLNQDAGNAVAHGLSWQAGIEAITINPAIIFGFDDVVGSLTVDKEADVVVWDGDPLEVMSSPDHVFIKGDEVPLVSRQTRLRDRYMDLDESGMPLAYKK